VKIRFKARFSRFVFALAGVLLGAPASAQTVIFQLGVGGYSGTVDTYLQANSPNATAGTSPEIQIDQNPPATPVTFVAPSQGRLRFENLFGAGLNQIPTGATVTSATLTLFTSNVSTGSFTIHRTSVGWSETSTWNTFGGDGVTLGSDALTSPTQTFVPSGLGLLSINVTADVQTWSLGASNFGWALLTTSTDGWDFTSSNGATISERPLLSVNFVPVPEPSSALLIVAGAAILAAHTLIRRRKRSEQGRMSRSCSSPKV